MKTEALGRVIRFAADQLDGTKREGLSYEADAELVALVSAAKDSERAATLAWNEAVEAGAAELARQARIAADMGANDVATHWRNAADCIRALKRTT